MDPMPPMATPEPDPADRRAWNIYLTNRARPLIEQLNGIAGDLLAVAFDGIEQPARDALAATLRRIHANLSVSDPKDQAAHG